LSEGGSQKWTTLSARGQLATSADMHKGLAKFFDFRGKDIESGKLAIGKFWNVWWLVGISQWQAWVAVASL